MNSIQRCLILKDITGLSCQSGKILFLLQFSSVAHRVRLFVTPWIAALQASLSITNSRSSLRPTSIESVMPSSHLILCRPLLLLPPIPPSITVFSNESTLRTRWPKYWSFSFSIIPSKEIPGLISFRMGWLDLLSVQGTLKSLLQHQSSKTSSLQHSSFFIGQLSHPYMTTGKIIALTIQTFVGQVMSLLFNILSRLVIAFLPRSKHLLIWITSLFESLQIKANIYLHAPERGRLRCLPAGLLHLWHLCSHRYHKIWQPYGYWLLQSIPATPGLPNANIEPMSPKAQAQYNANNCPNPH